MSLVDVFISLINFISGCKGWAELRNYITVHMLYQKLRRLKVCSSELLPCTAENYPVAVT